MKYFTPDLILRVGTSDPAGANAADAEWDRRLEEYEKHREAILLRLPEHVRQYEGLLLHDAQVWCMTRQGDKLTMIMRKDIPPRDVVQMIYTLAADPVINPAALPREEFARGMQYLYNEFDMTQEDAPTVYTESILFSNGWEMRLEYTDVHVTLAQPLYPIADGIGAPPSTAALPHPA